MIDTIYCDMDGVLADFYQRFLEYYPDTTLDERGWITGHHHRDGVWKNWLDWDTLREKDPKFWVGLDPMPGAEKLWQALLLVESTGVKLNILTAAPPEWKETAAQKRLWAEKFTGDKSFAHPNKTIVVFNAKDKAKNYARPNTLLIDDKYESCEEFKKAGSNSIWYDSRNTDLAMSQLFDVFFQG